MRPVLTSVDGRRLLEVGRIDKAHGLAGEVAGHASPPTSTDRLAPGSVVIARRRRPRRSWSSRSRPHQQRWIVTFEGVDTPRGRPRRCAARPAAPSRSIDDDDPDALWVHELIGAEVRRRRRRRPRHASSTVLDNPASRPPRARQRRPGAAALRRSSHEPGRASSSTCPPGLFDRRRLTGDAVHAHRRLHDLPGDGRRLRRPEPARPGPRSGPARRPGPRPAGRRPPTCTARSTTRPSAAARAWCSCPSRSSPRSRRSTRPGRCSCSAPAGRTLRPGHGPRSWPARDGFSLLCGRYEGVDERVRTHLVDGELSIGDYVLAGGEVAAMVVLEAVGRLVPGRDGQRRLGRRRVVLGRPAAARVPAVHQAGRVPGLGGARGAALGRPRPHRPVAPGPGPAPHARRRGPT